LNDHNYLTTTDENNAPMINPDYYRNILTDFINDYMKETETPRNKLTGNDFLAICRKTYNTIFKPDTTQVYKKCNIPYTEYNINTLYNLYIDICLSYKIHPSMYAFSIMTGLDEGTIYRYVTPSRDETLFLRREMLRNELAQDKFGRVVLANNDSSYGLEYEKKNTVEREQIKQGLSLYDLPQING